MLFQAERGTTVPVPWLSVRRGKAALLPGATADDVGAGAELRHREFSEPAIRVTPSNAHQLSRNSPSRPSPGFRTPHFERAMSSPGEAAGFEPWMGLATECLGQTGCAVAAGRLWGKKYSALVFGEIWTRNKAELQKCCFECCE